MISEAFFLNVINLPEAQGGDKMTAYETQERVKEYIRRALPLFEPMEVEYNGGLCEQTWNVAMDLGMFGSFEDMPDLLDYARARKSTGSSKARCRRPTIA
jgi:hypothetical protein